MGGQGAALSLPSWEARKRAVHPSWVPACILVGRWMHLGGVLEREL